MRRFCTAALAWLAVAFLRVLHLTLRRRVIGVLPAADDAVVYAFWHGEQQLVLAHLGRGREVAVMSSLSRDGRLQAGILTRLGLCVVAGSSSRGGASGLLALTRHVRDGRSAALAVDGPRGPRHVAKPGAAQLARLTGARIVPLRARASRSWVFERSWDRFVVPRPFARVELEVLDPVTVSRRADRTQLDAITATLASRLGSDPCQANLTPGRAAS